MRKQILVLILLLWTFMSTAQVTNQNLYDTLPTLVEHYHERLAEFKKEPVVKGRIVFVGNSITEGGQWHGLTDNNTRINRGIGGDVTFGVLNRLGEIIRLDPAKVFIMIGINDISKDFPEAVILNNYRRIVTQLKKDLPSSEIYIQSLLPVNPDYPRFPQHYDKGDHVISLNRKLKELAVAEDIRFVNLYPLFLDKNNVMDFRFTSDGLHLNEEGYKLWINYLRENKLI